MTRYNARALRTQLLALLLLGTACSLDEGSGATSNLDAGPTLDQSVPDDASGQGDAGPGLDATDDVTVDAPLPQPDAACDPSACPGERCLAGVCSFYASCNEMHQADSLRKTGPHKLSDPKQAIYEAWCDMDLDGGGWTLIGRSFPLASSSSFGWKNATGSVANDLTPYSLAVEAHGLAFTEVVVGTYIVAKTWYGSAYKATLPPGLLANYKNSATGVTVSKIGGVCPDSISPSMLANVGYVDDNNQFFLRDNTSAGDFGLRAGGFALAAYDCAQSGLMHLAQGMIAVR